MPKKTREQSSTDIYHAIWRGVGKQNIFIDDYDYRKFLYVLGDCKEKYKSEIYAYCLMSNHVHLLIKTDNISMFMCELGRNYAQWFNTKYERNGHLFQDRFLSEPVENDGYFVTVVRYIHQNPLKAGMVTSVDSYKWSSYNDYINKNEFVNYSMFNDIIGEKKFIDFNNMLTDESCLEIKEIKKKITDEKAVQLIMKYSKTNSVYGINELSNKDKTSVLKKLMDNNATVGQLARLTGMGKYQIKSLLK